MRNTSVRFADIDTHDIPGTLAPIPVKDKQEALFPAMINMRFQF